MFFRKSVIIILLFFRRFSVFRFFERNFGIRVIFLYSLITAVRFFRNPVKPVPVFLFLIYAEVTGLPRIGAGNGTDFSVRADNIPCFDCMLSLFTAVIFFPPLFRTLNRLLCCVDYETLSFFTGNLSFFLDMNNPSSILLTERITVVTWESNKQLSDSQVT